MRRFAERLAPAAAVLALVSACQTDDPTAPRDADPGTLTTSLQTDQTPFQLNTNQTSFQLSLMEAIARRKAQGLPVPSDASFEYESETAAPLAVLRQRGMQPGEDLTIVATTVLHFDSPEQAGLTEWPAVVVVDTRPDPQQGFINEGDYSQMIRDNLAEVSPDIWTTYEFGHEPRTYTFVETYRITYGELPAARLLPTPADAVTTGQNDIVTGFTVPGPMLDHTITFNVTVPTPVGDAEIIDFVAGFRLDWALGVRLPMNIAVSSTDPVFEGSTLVPISNVVGVDWSPAQFQAAGLEPEEGNEFAMRFEFLLGIFLTVVGTDVIDIGPNIDIDESSSFASPFGPGAVFALPTIDVPIFDRSFGPATVSIGFAVTPHAGSDKFTASWLAGGEASGGGSLTYTDPAVTVPLSSVTAIDGPGLASMTLRDFEYVFTQFLLDLALFLQLDVQVPAFDDVSERFEVPVTDFDLSNIIPDLAAPVHPGSTPTTLSTAVTILNVTPTAEIDRTETTVVNGISTFIGAPGAFAGTARDPGRDDLTLSWDWDDGAPSPDVSTTYPVPNEVTETRSHTFDAPSLYQVSFEAVDDDAAVGRDEVPVVIVSLISNRSRLAGYWQHQLSRRGRTDFEDTTLDSYLSIIGHMSAVFGEVRDVSTVAAAHDVLHLEQNAGSPQEKLDRELLVAWLNFCNAAFGYTELVDTDGDGIDDTPLGSALAVAEVVRLNPGATTAELNAQRAIVHAVNVSRVGMRTVSSAL